MDWNEYNRGRKAVRLFTRIKLERPDLWLQIKAHLRRIM